MSFKTRYSAARNSTWIWYGLGGFCVIKAAMAIQVHIHNAASGFPIAAAAWVGAATGLIYSAGAAKRKAEKQALYERLKAQDEAERGVRIAEPAITIENPNDLELAAQIASLINKSRNGGGQ